MLAHILSWYRRIRLPEMTLLISFMATGFGRMNVRDGQMGLLLCVLVLGTFILARSRRNLWAGLLLGCVTFKPTFFPLYVGYYLLRGSYRLVVACGLVAILYTTLPVVLTGRALVETSMAWLQSLERQNAAGIIDDPSPFTPTSALMSHLEPLVYRVFNAQTTVTTAIAWLFILLLAMAVAYLLWQTQPADQGELLGFGLVSALSLLSIYHRPYDVFLLFPGIQYLYVHAVSATAKTMQRNWGLFIAAVMLMLILPIDLSTKISALYPDLLESYFWRLVAPFHAWAGVAVFGALLWLRIKLPQPNEQQDQR
jgi:hypothetical protein